MYCEEFWIVNSAAHLCTHDTYLLSSCWLGLRTGTTWTGNFLFNQRPSPHSETYFDPLQLFAFFLVPEQCFLAKLVCLLQVIAGIKSNPGLVLLGLYTSQIKCSTVSVRRNSCNDRCRMTKCANQPSGSQWSAAFIEACCTHNTSAIISSTMKKHCNKQHYNEQQCNTR